MRQKKLLTGTNYVAIRGQGGYVESRDSVGSGSKMIGRTPVTFRLACIVTVVILSNGVNLEIDLLGRNETLCLPHHDYPPTWGGQPRFSAPALERVRRPRVRHDGDTDI